MSVNLRIKNLNENPSPPTPLPEDGARRVEVLCSPLSEDGARGVEVVANERTRLRVSRRLVFVLIALVMKVGCSQKVEPPQEALTQVTGQLLIDGQGIEGVSLKLIPTRVDMRQMREPGAITEKDGRFTMSYKGVHDGVPPGEYLLLAFWLEQPEGGGMMHDRLQGKYMNLDEPIRKISVAEQAIDLGKIEIEMKE